MNLFELKQSVDHAIESCKQSHKDPDKITVLIPSYKLGTAGHRPCTTVKYANMGFDWESSSFLLIPDQELREINRDEIEVLRKKYEELSWTHYKISKIKSENKDLKEQLEKIKSSK